MGGGRVGVDAKRLRYGAAGGLGWDRETRMRLNNPERRGYWESQEHVGEDDVY